MSIFLRSERGRVVGGVSRVVMISVNLVKLSENIYILDKIFGYIV